MTPPSSERSRRVGRGNSRLRSPLPEPLSALRRGARERSRYALLVELLGVDPEKERRAAEGLDAYVDYWESRVAFLPENKREAVLDYLDAFEIRMQEFYVEKNKKAMVAEMAVTLGAGKAKEYERSQDYAYQQLQRLTKKNDLGTETAGRIYDFKEATEEAAKELRQNQELSKEQQQAALQDIRTELESSMKDLLGEKNFNSYLRQGGWWINNIHRAR